MKFNTEYVKVTITIENSTSIKTILIPEVHSSSIDLDEEFNLDENSTCVVLTMHPKRDLFKYRYIIKTEEKN